MSSATMSSYLARREDGSTVGPLSLAQIRAMAEKGELGNRVEIRTQGETEWMPLPVLRPVPPPSVSRRESAPATADLGTERERPADAKTNSPQGSPPSDSKRNTESSSARAIPLQPVANPSVTSQPVAAKPVVTEPVVTKPAATRPVVAVAPAAASAPALATPVATVRATSARATTPGGSATPAAVETGITEKLSELEPLRTKDIEQSTSSTSSQANATGPEQDGVQRVGSESRRSTSPSQPRSASALGAADEADFFEDDERPTEIRNEAGREPAPAAAEIADPQPEWADLPRAEPEFPSPAQHEHPSEFPALATDAQAPHGPAPALVAVLGWILAALIVAAATWLATSGLAAAAVGTALGGVLAVGLLLTLAHLIRIQEQQRWLLGQVLSRLDQPQPHAVEHPPA